MRYLVFALSIILAGCSDTEAEEKNAFLKARGEMAAAETARVAAEKLQASPTEVIARPKQVAAAGRALTDAQIDRMTTFATMIGRGIGCGLDVGEQTQSIATWLNQNVPDREARQAYVAVVETAVQSAAAQQNAGQTPDTCSAVERGLRGATIR